MLAADMAKHQGYTYSPDEEIYWIVPEYDKVMFGNIITLEIGMTTILEKCPRFRGWTELLIRKCTEKRELPDESTFFEGLAVVGAA